MVNLRFYIWGFFDFCCLIRVSLSVLKYFEICYVSLLILNNVLLFSNKDILKIVWKIFGRWVFMYNFFYDNEFDLYVIEKLNEWFFSWCKICFEIEVKYKCELVLYIS